MQQIKEVLRLHHEAKLAYSQIALACGLSKGVVGKYLSLAKAEGIGWPLPERMDEAQLQSRLFADNKRPRRFVEPDFAAIHQELKGKGVTLQLLWSEYSAAHGDGAYRYSQFCFHYQRWRKRQKRSMRQLHRAGEKLFIDYCGPTVPIVDATTGELRQAQVFVAVLGASSYTYAEATWTQELPQRGRGSDLAIQHNAVLQDLTPEFFDRILEQRPHELRALHGRANVLIGQGQLDEAGTVLDRADEIQKGLVITEYLRGVVASRAKDSAAAKTRFERVFGAVPGHIQSLFALGIISLSENELEIAEERLSAVLSAVPGNLHAAKVLAATRLRLGELP